MSNVRPFEIEILKDFKAYGYSSGPGPKASWVRGYLLEVQKDYGTSMFKHYVSFCDAARLQGAKLRTAKESSFFAYLSMLRHLGLIVSVTPYKWAPRKRHYFKLTPQKISEEFWHNPRLQLYRNSWRKAPKKAKPPGRRPSADSQRAKIARMTSSPS